MSVRERRDPGSEPSVYQMKLQRLKEDGRLREFRERVRERMRAAGVDPSGSSWSSYAGPVLDEMLPDGDATMIEEYRERVVELEYLERQQAEISAAESEREQVHRTEFEKAFSELPLEASHGDVMSWVENHPAMNLRDDVELTAEDIRDAPSRSAVGHLRHWLENKGEFYRQWMQRARKDGFAVSSDGESGAVVDERVEDPKISEIEQMLSDLSSRVGGG